MTTLNPPFQATDMQGLYRKVIKGMYPEISSHYSVDLSNVIRSMMQVNPSVRPSCDKILEMAPVIRNMNFKRVDAGELNVELLSTIKFVPSLKLLTNRLPAANYDKRSRGFSAKIPKFEGFNNKENLSVIHKRERDTSEENAKILSRPPLYKKCIY